MKPKNLKTKCARAAAVIEEIERLTVDRKKLYEEHDELVAELRNAPGLETFGIRLVSTFAKGNTQWGHGPVRELVLEKIEAENKMASKSK